MDNYDALITDRPYRPRLSREEAFGILRAAAAKGTLDPALVASLIAMVEEEEGPAPVPGGMAPEEGAAR